MVAVRTWMMFTTAVASLRRVTSRLARGMKTVLALLVVIPTIYMLFVVLLQVEPTAGDDAFYMVLMVIVWYSGLVLALGVVVHRGYRRVQAMRLNASERKHVDHPQSERLTQRLETVLALLIIFPLLLLAIPLHVGLAPIFVSMFFGILLALTVLYSHGRSLTRRFHDDDRSIR